MQRKCASALRSSFPASTYTCIKVAAIPKGGRLEVETIAAR